MKGESESFPGYCNTDAKDKRDTCPAVQPQQRSLSSEVGLVTPLALGIGSVTCMVVIYPYMQNSGSTIGHLQHVVPLCAI